jgi:hypothetical protein
VKLDALDHPKTFDLAARLGVELPTALGHLELLWAFTGKQAPQGNVGKWADGAIARACYWMGNPEKFIRGLVEAGFLDEHGKHRLTVHHWSEHAPRWVKSKLKSIGQSFVEDEIEDVSEDIYPDVVEDVSPPSKGREGKTREGKPDPHSRARLTPGLDLPAWDRWLEYRQAKGKKIGPESAEAAAKALAAFHGEQSAVVEQSISNGWQGLFELKTKNGANGHTHVSSKGAEAWDALIASDGAKRDPSAQRALDAIGGWSVVKERTTFNSAKLKAEFCRVYGGH